MPTEHDGLATLFTPFSSFTYHGTHVRVVLASDSRWSLPVFNIHNYARVPREMLSILSMIYIAELLPIPTATGQRSKVWSIAWSTTPQVDRTRR
jgi:hypothetical protein